MITTTLRREHQWPRESLQLNDVNVRNASEAKTGWEQAGIKGPSVSRAVRGKRKSWRAYFSDLERAPRQLFPTEFQGSPGKGWRGSARD